MSAQATQHARARGSCALPFRSPPAHPLPRLPPAVKPPPCHSYRSAAPFRLPLCRSCLVPPYAHAYFCPMSTHPRAEGGQAGPGHGSHVLLTVDESGMCCVWAEPQGLCVRRQRIAELAGPGVVFAAAPSQVGTAGSRTASNLP